VVVMTNRISVPEASLSASGRPRQSPVHRSIDAPTGWQPTNWPCSCGTGRAPREANN